MVGNVIFLLLLYGVFFGFLTITMKDNDFKEITVTKKDKLWFGFYMACFTFLVIKMPFFPKLYASISLPVLLISAYTDKKLKLLYNAVFYVLAPLAIIAETLYASLIITIDKTSFVFHLSVHTLMIILFAVILELLGMYGNGDKGMVIVCGCIWYLLNPDHGGTEALLADCIMILIAEVLFYIKAVKEKNLDGPFRLKESRPLGPELLTATTIVLFYGIFNL